MCRDKALINERVTYEPNTGCWLFVGSLEGHGYPSRIDLGRRGRVRAHRLAFEVFVGPIPSGHEIDHLCGVRSCCNPAHLEVVTRQENAKRRSEAQTHCVNGHALDDCNTYVDPRGWRQCRRCKQERVGQARPIANGQKSHCQHGHEFTEANTRVDALGRRYCRTCARKRESYDRSRF